MYFIEDYVYVDASKIECYCDCRANGVQNTCQNIICVRCVSGIDTDAKMKIAVRAGFC